MSKNIKREYQPIDAVINEIVENFGLENEFLSEKIKQLWVEIVGENIAKNATISRFRDGILFIQCSSSAWRSELLLRKNKLTERFNQLLNANKIKNIIIK